MAQSFDVLPSGDIENDGWTLVASSATTVWEILSAAVDDGCYVRPASYRGAIEVRFPTDVTDLPSGAIIDSVTVFVRMKTNAGSGARGVTVHTLSSDNRSRYTTRSLTATSTIKTYELGTYSKDPLGKAWDVQRLNKLRARFYSQNNFSDSIRVYSLYVRVNFHTRPTVSVTSPSGTTGSPSPVVDWAYTQEEGEPQKSAEYKVYSLATATAKGFSPDTTAPIYRGTTSGISHNLVLPTSLNNGDYKIYVRATSQHNATSNWASKQFKVTAPSPGVPGDDNAGDSGLPGVGTPTVVPDNYTSSAAIRMTDTSNLLSVQQADFEIASDPLGWVKGESTTTLARDTAKAYGEGEASMSITAGAAADASAVTTFIEVDPELAVTLRAQTLTAATSRTLSLTARFYDEGHTLLGGTVTASGADATSTWTEIVATGTTPADAKFAEIVVTVASAANAEVHYVDHIGLMYGTNTAWSDGGHSSRNLLTSFLATGDDPESTVDSWTAENAGTTVTRVTNASLSNPTGAHGEKCHQMTAVAVSPSIAFRSAGTTGTSTIFNSATAGTNFTLFKPTTSAVQENDLMIAFVTSTGVGDINPPSGWTAVNKVAVTDVGVGGQSGNVGLWILKRTAGASEPSSWTTGTLSESSTRRSAVVIAYSGAANADDQFVAESGRTQTNEPSSIATPTISNTVANAWRIAAFAANDDHTISMVANTTPPQPPGIKYVGKATAWSQTSSTTSYTINKPAGVASGDLMIASILITGSSTTINTPTGWTLVRKSSVGTFGESSGSLTMAVFHRTAGGSEPNSWTATHGASARPKISQCVAYRYVDTSTGPFIAERGATKLGGSSISSGNLTNTDGRAWRVSVFGAASPYANAWDQIDWVERADDTTSLADFYDTVLAVSDSDGHAVSTGTESRTATIRDDSFAAAVGWLGLLKPLAAAPAAGANETERVDYQNGASNPWTDIGVYDSNGVVGLGQQTVYGIMTTGDTLGTTSAASWIGLIRPAASIEGGVVGAHPSSAIDLDDVDPEAFTLADNKLTVMADFRGSVSGTPTLTAEFYRANTLISSASAVGNAFNDSSFTKSWAVFDIPTGTTRIRPVLSALDRAVDDTVQFDRVSVSLGSLSDPAQEPKWRNGTARPEHSVWSKPIIQFQENDGTGYGDWMPLMGQKALPPAYDANTSQMFYVDHTIIPLASRRYRVATYAYGLAGDFFSSGYGPASQEAVFESRAWWLKDILDLSKNMQITVRWKDQDVDTANSATAFQPLGADLPIVVSEGFKGDTFDLEIHCEQVEFVSLMKLLNSGRTLILQSDIDKMWWVRPLGNIKSNILATGSRQERPRRYVTVTFAQVAAEE